MILRSFAIAVILLSMACASRRTSRSEVATGVLEIEATHKAAYCGGAEPLPEHMPQIEPWIGTLYLRAVHADGEGMAINDPKLPLIDSLRTDADGRASAELPSGTYLLLDRDHAMVTRYEQVLSDHATAGQHHNAVDKQCLDEWFQGPFRVITIRAGEVTRHEWHTHGRCPWNAIPCVVYRGPLPP